MHPDLEIVAADERGGEDNHQPFTLGTKALTEKKRGDYGGSYHRPMKMDPCRVSTFAFHIYKK